MPGGGTRESVEGRLRGGLRTAVWLLVLVLPAPSLAGPVEVTATPEGWELRLAVDPDDIVLDPATGGPRVAGLSSQFLGAGIDTPAAVVSLAIPDGARLRLETGPDDRHPLEAAPPARGTAELLANAAAVEMEEARFRGLRLVRIVFRPLTVDATGSWQLRSSMQARLLTTGGDAFGAPRGGWAEADRAVLRAALANGEQATAGAAVIGVAPAAPPEPPATAGAINPGVKIRLDSTGLVRVTVAELETAGFDPIGVTPDHLEVALRGTPIPARVVGGGDGTLDPGDAVEFYADPAPGRYATDVVYWLEEKDAPGLRFASRAAAPGGGAPVSRFDHIEHYEEGNDLYTFGRPAEEGDPHFFWVYFGEFQTTTFTHSAVLPSLDPSGTGAQLRAFFAGRTDDPAANPDHRVKFFVNGVEIGQSQWNGQNFHTALLPFDASLLNAGSNDFRLDFVSIAPNVDLYLLDWIEVEYPRVLVADGDRLTINGDGGAPARFDVGGFSGVSDLLVLDVTDPLAAVELTGFTVNGGTPPFGVSFEEPAPAGKRYHIAGDGGRVAASALELDLPSDLRAVTNGADQIIVVPDGWESELQGLVAHRQAQGTRVVLANLTDVADEFAGGNVDAEAIRDMVAYAYANWQPPAVSYLLLVGEPNLDGRNDLAQSPYYNFMPTHYGVTDIQGETLSDTWFGAVSGADLLPDVITGRFSVRSAPEAGALADKVIDYETQWPQGEAWGNNVLQIASNEAAFEASLEAAAGSLPGHFTVDSEYRRNGANSGSIEDAFDLGAVLASLMGHGNVTFWADSPGGPYFTDGDATDLLNSGRVPLVTAFNCLNGLIGHPFIIDSLAEVFHNQPQNGALGMWSPSSLGFLNEYDALQSIFYRVLFEDRVPEMGRAANLALIETWLTEPVSIDLLKEMVLLGDPAGWLAFDTDADTLPDAVEQRSGLPAGDGDGDDDGLADGLETNPTGDSDGDGLLDALDGDADGDALPDGLEAGVAVAGAGTDVTAGVFVADLDPLTTTDPTDPDSDGGGAPDGIEDRDGNGRLDAGETDPQNPGDDPTCVPGTPVEIGVLPADRLALARNGDDLQLAWGDASASDPCVYYRIWVADDLEGASGKSGFRLLGTRALPSFTHVGGALPGVDHRYVISGYSLAGGEGPWGHFE